MLKMKGLGLAQDLNHNNDVCGCFMLSQVKENSARNDDGDSEEDVYFSTRVRQLMLQGVMFPFTKHLREGNLPSSYDLMYDRTVASLKLDCDVPFLSLLK